MATTPRNNHEQVYIHMSMIVMDVKCYYIEQAYGCEVSSFLKE